MHRNSLLLSGLLLLGLAFALHLNAQTGQQCVVVETAAGQRMEYLLSDLPRIVHNDATVTLSTSNATVEFQTSEVAKVYVSTTSNHVVAVRDMTDGGHVRVSGDAVCLSGYSPREAVSLYTTDGKLLKQYATDDQGRLAVTLSRLHAGIYVLKTNQQSIKFTKK